MKRIVFAPRSRTARRLLASGALMGVLLAAGAAAIGDVSPEAKRSGATASRSLSLFAGPTVELTANQWKCGLANFGDVCANVFNSPTGGGGSWPIGTPNAYIFNTGMQIGGISADGNYAWANDTLGAFLFDASGIRPSGEAITNIYDSTNPEDLCGDADEDGYDDCWGMADYDPTASFPTLDDLYVTDETLFQENLLGRANISQQDSWVQYWDGSPTRITDRQHPMGLLITQRSLAWNYPTGNESILYFIFEIRNVTHTPEFQGPNELAFFGGDPTGIPDEGITFNEVYAGFSTDMDVTDDASANFSTAILPFDLGLSYHGGFDAPEFEYPASIFFPPFFTNAPGIVGVKYLRSPVSPETGEEVGLTRFSITLNGGPAGSVSDPRSDKQLWRYHSGFLNPAAGDAPCSVAPQVDTGIPETTEQSVCFVFQSAFDTRFFQSSGPFSLAPNESATVVVAYVVAATVETMPDATPSGIDVNADDNANPPGIPSFHPGFPSHRGCDINGNNCSVENNINPVKPIERGAGWFRYNGPAPSGRGGGAMEGPENKLPLFDETGAPYMELVPGSLLGKALVAQTIFDSKFLLGFAPIQPVSYNVPGNNAVTIIWEKSATEEIGDPFYAVASDSTSALYNPNYRYNDVEAYAIWRTVGTSGPELVAFFDYANTTFDDRTCETVLPNEDVHDYSALTPPGTIGFVAGEECADDFLKSQSINTDMWFNNGSIGGPPGGGVVRLVDSTAAPDGSILTQGLTQVGVDDWDYPGLTDSGVTFAFTDNNAVNNFTYFYGVQAIDINSFASGPYTLTSARTTSRATPRQDSQNLSVATIEFSIAGDDGVTLDPRGEFPSIDPENGTFSGPMPPTNALMLGFSPLVERLLPDMAVYATIDSMVPLSAYTSDCPAGSNLTNGCWKMYTTTHYPDGSTVPTVVDGWTPIRQPWAGVYQTEYEIVSAPVAFDATALEDFGIPPTASGTATATGLYSESIWYANFEGQLNRRNASSNIIHGGSRWFTGDNESVVDPTMYIRVGHLDGIDSVWSPIHHTPIEFGAGTYPASGSIQCWGYASSFLGRAADFEVTWQGGTIQVRDVTHSVDVLYDPNPRLSWGFMNTDGNDNGFIDWDDFDFLDSIYDNTLNTSYCAGPTAGDPKSTLDSAPTIGPISTQGESVGSLAATGNGFALLINNQRFFFQTSAVPADGTVWTLRTYAGGAPQVDDDDVEDPTGYRWLAQANNTRPPTVAGLQMRWSTDMASSVIGTWDLSDVHTIPDPYLATSQYDLAPTAKQLQFVNLPPEATIRIYTLTGVLVNQIDHNDPTGGGRAVWDVRNWSQQFAASGVYFFHVITPEGDERVGKFTIVSFAGQN